MSTSRYVAGSGKRLRAGLFNWRFSTLDKQYPKDRVVHFLQGTIALASKAFDSAKVVLPLTAVLN